KYTGFDREGAKSSKVDRFLVNFRFFDLWKDAVFSVLPKALSDHCPIFLKVGSPNFGPKPFKVFDKWLNDVAFQELISSFWADFYNSLSPDLVLKNKLRSLRLEIKKWAADRFASENRLRDKLYKNLEAWDEKAEDGCINHQDILKREEWILDLLQLDRLRNEDDENLCFFHSILKSRYAKCSMKGIYNNGIWVDSPDDIKLAAMQHYAAGFKESDAHRPLLESHLFHKLSSCDAAFLESSFSIEEVKAALLASRLAKVLSAIIGPNQSAFIKDRQILDGYLVANEIISSISILINGSPTNEFFMERGLRQGDPLSLLLFLLVAEALQVTIFNACDIGIFKGLRLADSDNNISLLQFADDALFFGEWSRLNASSLIDILRWFELGLGLKVNLDKSRIFGVGVPVNEVAAVASSLGCAHGVLPFIYLGLPVGRKMRLTDGWHGIIDRFRDRLSSWKAKTLSVGRRLTLIKSVLGSLPIYYLSHFKAPVKVIKLLKAIRCCLHSKNLSLLGKWKWRFLTKDHALWRTVIKEFYGGDGGFYSSSSSLWSSGVWVDIIKATKNIKVLDLNFKNSFVRKVADRANTSFWLDPWCGHGSRLKDKFPRLYALDSFKECKVKDRGFTANGSWVGTWSWRFSLRGCSLDDLKYLTSSLNTVLFSSSGRDKWVWTYEAFGFFNVKTLSKAIENSLLGVHSLGLHHKWNS
ncbi:RNA-directed DNA polymerase, eukaryota, reverse transcriptase zinc-binding domain protein, partial [Tanacetum coccineum]